MPQRDIKIARPEDCEEIVRLLVQTSEKSPMPYDVDVIRANVRSFLTKPLTESIILLAETDGKNVGLLVGYAAQGLFSAGLTTQELAWYVEDGYPREALQLFSLFEEWSRKIGAKYSLTATHHNISTDSLKRYYSKHGYKEIETHYGKEI